MYVGEVEFVKGQVGKLLQRELFILEEKEICFIEIARK